MISRAYQKDLAFVHDQGFSGFALRAGTFLVSLFSKPSLPGKHIVELGCGSGRLARILLRQGYSVTGVDVSRSMISLARKNAPAGTFLTDSLWRQRIPGCGAVLAVGEVLNYQFDGVASHRKLRHLFSRVYDSLLPSGVFVFDLLCERSGPVARTRSFTESDQWLVAVEKTDSPQRIVRRIITFRRWKKSYRRSFEIHTVFRYNLASVTASLRRIGFTVKVRKGYGEPLARSHVVIIARKPHATLRRHL